MNIAHIIPYSIGYPLKTHNGRYDWVHDIAVKQAQQGHTVTIYGSPHSSVEGVTTKGISDATDDTKQNNTQTFRLAFAADHEVYHSHFDNLHYAVADETTRPIVFTQHWWPTDETILAARAFAERAVPQNVWAVPPTQFMYERDQTAGIQSRGYIYHGTDLSFFHPSDAPRGNRLLFVGRISPEKNLDLAIHVALKAQVPLDIIGKVAPKNEAYWQTLLPLIDGESIRYLGAKSHAELVDYYGTARGVLFPSDINEPFGLVAIEAQACGTPVMMKRGGSRGELIKEGVTGFLCNDEHEFVSAIPLLDGIKKEDCIASAQRFNEETMVQAYSQLYETLTKS